MGNDLVLGKVAGQNSRLTFSSDLRSTHLYVAGGTGTGKSKFLEHLIRQDLLDWRPNRCGLLLLDPHGSLFESLMRWTASNDLKVPIVPIDLTQDQTIVSYNLLRKRDI